MLRKKKFTRSWLEHQLLTIAGSAALFMTLGCPSGGAPPPATIEPEPVSDLLTDKAGNTFKVHLGPAWFQTRARWLAMTPRAAVDRDAAISDQSPPLGFWDEQTATEAAAIWGALCNDCHGGRRKVSAAVNMPAPRSDWAKGETSYFFGRPRTHAEIFRTIYNGAAPKDGKPSEMPSWGGKLSREQIWAMIYFIEYQSGGTEGDFPPGLYPQRNPDAPDNN